MNDLVNELQQLQAGIPELEKQAQGHEQSARDCRARMAEAKARFAELRKIVTDAKAQQTAEELLRVAESARQATEAHKTEASALCDTLRLKEKELDDLVSKYKSLVQVAKEAELAAERR